MPTGCLPCWATQPLSHARTTATPGQKSTSLLRVLTDTLAEATAFKASQVLGWSWTTIHVVGRSVEALLYRTHAQPNHQAISLQPAGRPPQQQLPASSLQGVARDPACLLTAVTLWWMKHACGSPLFTSMQLRACQPARYACMHVEGGVDQREQRRRLHAVCTPHTQYHTTQTAWIFWLLSSFQLNPLHPYCRQPKHTGVHNCTHTTTTTTIVNATGMQEEEGVRATNQQTRKQACMCLSHSHTTNCSTGQTQTLSICCTKLGACALRMH